MTIEESKRLREEKNRLTIKESKRWCTWLRRTARVGPAVLGKRES